MSFWKSLFGGSKKEPKDQRGLELHLVFLDTLKAPAIALLASDGPTRSRIGGLPSLPDDIPWPLWKGKPMAFLCQLGLREIPAGCERHGLPDSGVLCFFYNQEQETWGFDPKDEGSWRVIYAAAADIGDARRAAPDGLEKGSIYPEKPVVLTPVETYPDCQDDRVGALDLSDDQIDEYDEWRLRGFGDAPQHQLFGHPTPVQGNYMDLDCQLVSNGLYCGKPSGYRDPRAAELEKGRQDWMLLLQLDSDDDAGMMWGDCGMLYFWIRKDDLRAGRFDKCWMILQCC